jgi:two-component sensor histidine kinase
LLAVPACAQRFPVLHYSIEDGLPANTIHDIYRDSKGMLWFSTNKGVARYNGVKFEVFTTFNGLPDNEIFFSREDHQGRMWFATYNGELCYYKDDSFHSAKTRPFLRKLLKSSMIRQISVEADSSITIVYNEGGTFSNIKGDRAHRIYVKKSFNGQRLDFEVRHISKLSPDLYKLNCGDKVVYVNASGAILKVSFSEPDLHVVHLSTQNQLYLLKDSSVSSCSGQFVTGLSSLKYFGALGLSPASVRRVYTGDGNLFICTDKGLLVNDTTMLFNGLDISAITQDCLGNYWVGTSQHGLYCFNRNFLKQNVSDNVYSGRLPFVYAKEGNLFYTTSDNSLFQLTQTGPRCVFNYSKYKHDRFDHFFEPGYFMDSAYRYYGLYNEDHMVVGDILSGHPTVTRYACNFVTPGIKNLFFVDNSLYIQDLTTIGRVDFFRSRISGMPDEAYHQVIDPYAPLRIFSSAQAPDNAIWYSTINYVFRFKDGKTAPVKQFGNTTFRSLSFCKNYLIGYTHSNKLLVCNTKDSILIDEVPSQNCIWDRMFTLDSNHMLISTNNLYRVVTVYPSDGKPRYSIKTIENSFVPRYCDAICSDGTTCYFFKNGSVTSVAVKDMLTAAPPPILFFTTLKSGNVSYAIGSNMEMSFADSRSITISFATVSFAGKGVSYQYSLSKDGIDSWKDITGDINILNPAYGTYDIKVRAKTISSEYTKPILFTLEVLRPFWATWWFITLAAILFGGAVYYSVRRLIAISLRKREKLYLSEVKFMKSEYKALNALMNPHFIFNTLNNVQGLINNNDKQAANQYLRVFSDLVRQNMHNVSREMIPLQKEIDLVNNYLLLEKLRFEDKLHYSMHIDSSVDLSEIMIPPLLIQPLVENSIKHGILPLQHGLGQIQIRIYERNSYVYIEVKDNGVGIQAGEARGEKLHESFGLENIRSRISHLSAIQNKKITLDFSEATDSDHKWTVVTTGLPM